jgi:hypothetical protein
MTKVPGFIHTISRVAPPGSSKVISLAAFSLAETLAGNIKRIHSIPGM